MRKPPIGPILLIALGMVWFGPASAAAAISAQVAANQLVVGGDGGPNQITLRLFVFDNSQIRRRRRRSASRSCARTERR